MKRDPNAAFWTCDDVPFDDWLAIIDAWSSKLFGLGVEDMPDLWMARDAYDNGTTVRDGLIEWADEQAEDNSAFAEVYENTHIPE